MSILIDPARAEALHRRAQALLADLRSTKRDLSLLLAEVDAGRLYRALGYGSLAAYAEHALGLRPRTARAMANLGRRLPELPALDEALKTGALGWTHARTLLPVLEPNNEAAWVERARELTVRDLEEHVSASPRGAAPPTDEQLRELRAMPGRTKFVATCDAAQRQIIGDALAALRAETGLSEEELSDGALLAMALQRVLHDMEGEEAPTGPRYQVALQHDPESGRTAGLDVPVGDTHAAIGLCDAEVVDLRDGSTRGHRRRAIPPSIRNAVVLRDQRRCVNPRCTNRLWIDLHHLVPVSRGGSNREANLVCQCSCCHQAHHDGHLGIEPGVEPGVVVFRYRDGAVVRVRLGEGPLDDPYPSKPTPQELFAFAWPGHRLPARAVPAASRMAVPSGGRGRLLETVGG